MHTANAPSVLLNWGLTRLFVPGALTGINEASPYSYSTTEGSDFRNMVQAIYDNSYHTNLSLDTRKGIAYYYGFPGYGAGHYLSIVKQVLAKANPALDISVLVLAQAGIAGEDAGVGCVKVKYANSVVRPQTYIRKVLGYDGISKPLFSVNFLGTAGAGQPNHPDYPSGHSTLAGATVEVLEYHFGDNFSFTDASFAGFIPADQRLAARSHSSLTDFANEIGDSRVYAQIHYPRSCEDGQVLGRKVAQNVLNTLKFLKE